jgi:hypothetical protein
MILLYKGKSFVSWRIRMATLSEYSHQAWLKTTQTLRDMIRIDPNSDVVKRLIIEAGCIEAWEGVGVRETYSLKAGHTSGTEIDVYDLPEMDELKFKLIEDYMRQQLGKPYWYRGILYARFNLFRGKEPPTDAEGHISTYFCSMLGEDALRFVDWPTVDLRCPIHGVWPGKTGDSVMTKYLCTVTI